MVSFSSASLSLVVLAVASSAVGDKNFDCIMKNWSSIKAHLDNDLKGSAQIIQNLPENFKTFFNKDGTIVSSPSDEMITNGLKGLDAQGISDLTNGLC